jgi:hypothetical protein
MAGLLAVEGGRGGVGGKGATGWVHGEASKKRSYDSRQRSELASEAFERHVRDERASGGALVRLLGLQTASTAALIFLGPFCYA